MFDWSYFQSVEGLGVAIGISFNLLLVYFIFKRKKSNKKPVLKAVGAVEDDSIDYEALTKAEQQVASLDIRAEITRDHTRVKDFSNMYGYHESYVSDLVEKLEKNNISAQYLFVPSLPTGVASYVGSAGTWELYVERAKRDQAVELLKSWGVKI